MSTRVTEVTMSSEDDEEDDVLVDSSRKWSPTARQQNDDEIENFPPLDYPDDTEDEDGDAADEDENDFSISKSLCGLGDIEVRQKKILNLPKSGQEGKIQMKMMKHLWKFLNLCLRMVL